MGYKRAPVKPGASLNKWTESLTLGGGVSAILLPFVCYYIAWKQIRDQKEYEECKAKMKKEEDGGDDVDYLTYCFRSTMIMMCVYMLLYFILFTRPALISKKAIKVFSVITGLLLLITLIINIENYVYLGLSFCKDKAYG